METLQVTQPGLLAQRQVMWGTLTPQLLSNPGENIKHPSLVHTCHLCGEVLQSPSLDWQQHGSLAHTQTIVEFVEQNLPNSPY